MLSQDLKTGWRSLWKTPWLTLTAIVMLAIGIGANTAIFSLVNQLMFTPPPGKDLDRVVIIGLRHKQEDWFGYVYKENVFSAVENLQSFEQTGIAVEMFLTLSGGPESTRLGGLRTGKGFLSTLGIQAHRGRCIEDADYEGGAAPVIMISYEFWESFFKKDEAIIGKTFGVDGVGHTLVGVLPKRFKFLSFPCNVLVASTMREENFSGCYLPYWPIVGRLKPGVTVEGAFAEYSTLFYNLQLSGKTPNEMLVPDFLKLHELRSSWLKQQVYMVHAVAFFILLICVFNVANLELAKSRRKSRELSIRTALGASPRLLFQQTLVEHALLGLLGGIAGVVSGMVSIRMITKHFAGSDWGLLSNLHTEITLDLNVLLFAVGTTTLAILLIGLVPATLAMRTNLSQALNESGRGSSDGKGFRRFRCILAGVQIALTTLLVIMGTLFLLEMNRTRNYDYGVSWDGMLQVGVDLPFYNYEKGAGDRNTIAIKQRLADSIKAIPGVEQVAFGQYPATFVWPDTPFRLNAMPESLTPDLMPKTSMLFGGTGYMEIFNLPLLQGETISYVHNQPGAEQVCLINKSLAENYFRDRNPLGEYVELHTWNPYCKGRFRIIGITGDVHIFWNDNSNVVTVPYLYAQETFAGPFFIRTKSDPNTYRDKIHAVIREAHPESFIHKVQTLDEYLEETNSSFRFLVFAQVLFACIGLFLACLGIFGVMSYGVGQRVREIGIRLALGSSPHAIIKMIMRDALWMVVPGIALGLGTALLLGGFVAMQLEVTSPYEWPVYLFATLILAITSLISCWFPARQASRVNPSTLLREQIR